MKLSKIRQIDLQYGHLEMHQTVLHMLGWGRVINVHNLFTVINTLYTFATAGPHA